MGGPASPSPLLLPVLTVVRLRELAGSEELRLLRTFKRPPAVLETSSVTTERLLSSPWTVLEFGLLLLGKLENIRPGISSWGRAAARETLRRLRSNNTFIFILERHHDNDNGTTMINLLSSLTLS